MTATSAVETPEEIVRLRAEPPRVMRLSRKAITAAGASAFVVVTGTLVYALWPTHKQPADELYNTDANRAADTFAAAPKDYRQVPRLGPPLPGDLGKPILDARQGGELETPSRAEQLESPALAAARTERQRVRAERDAARSSRLFVTANPAASAIATTSEPDPTGGSAAAEASIDPKRAFLEQATDHRTVALPQLVPAAGQYVLIAGTVIPAALVTGIRSDLPGQITGQVTQNVYDSATGRHLLIAQGSRLIGQYDADVAFGQSRVLLVWTRVILPDGRSITLERLPGVDAQGFAGLEDGTDYHWGGVFRAAAVSTLLGVGAELTTGGGGGLVRALRRGTQDSFNQAGQQVVARELSVRPTLTIRPGHPVRVIVTRDLVLEPLEGRR